MEYSEDFPQSERVFSNLATKVSGTASGCLAFTINQVGDRFFVTHNSPGFEVAFDFPGWTPIFVDGRPVMRDVPVQAVLHWIGDGDFVRLRLDSDVDPAFWLEVCFTRIVRPVNP